MPRWALGASVLAIVCTTWFDYKCDNLLIKTLNVLRYVIVVIAETALTCKPVDFLSGDEPSDTTESVERQSHLDPIHPIYSNHSSITYLPICTADRLIICFSDGVRKAVVFLLTALVLNCLGFVASFASCRRRRSYRLLLCSALLHIFGGMALFLCKIVYMASLSKEVGKKLYPTQLDDPLFHYSYGYSFICVMVSWISLHNNYG